MHTLLLADDSITVQRVIGLTFANEDFRIVSVSDGQAAIDRITSQRPDIVLAGTTMPNVNGYDVASFVRSQPALKGMPVLLLTGAFESVDPARLKASGANGVLEKPLEPTNVISRVKELLGIKGDVRPAPAPHPQREAPASAHARHSEPPPVRASHASSWDELRQSSGLAPDARSVEAGNGSDGEDYLDTLDAAFDSLDAHLAGHGSEMPRFDRQNRTERFNRNPAPPLAHHGTAVDPRSPSRRPAAPVAQEAPLSPPIFEVDDDWFAEDDMAKEERTAEQKLLAAEMGIHDVEVPEEPAAAPAQDLDFDFGADGEPKPVAAMPPPQPEPVTPPPAAPVPRGAPAAPSRDVADDFAALLAFEQGERPHPPAPAPAPVMVPMAPPEITDAMLDQIAERVADRLNAGTFAAHIREAMTTTVRETVRSVVSDTSERLVRDEIARIKAQAERDTQ